MKKSNMRWLALSVALCVVLAGGCKKAENKEAADQHKAGSTESVKKPDAAASLAILKEGNARFVAGKSSHPNADINRLKLAAAESQAKYAYATVISCSDSRVPVELIFDAGVMDLFIVRVAGNVCDNDEIGSIEYGLGHVKTPVLVVMGHTQCGAVTAVTAEVNGHGHALEANIPGLVDNIIPAVKRAQKAHPAVKGEEIIPFAIEENVWQGVEDLFMKSAATRELVKGGEVKVVGSVYDLSTGTVTWLPEEKVQEILKKVEKDPKRSKLAAPASHESH